MQKYVVLEKQIGETPLSCMEQWRKNTNLSVDIPLTYAGRLDPMASGKLLVLIGEECKKKDDYLKLDKEYEFEILFGLASDTADVLGRLSPSDPMLFDERVIQNTLQELTGTIELPYPHFSSKTVLGKPLHTWKLENRLDEIEIPTKSSQVYRLQLEGMYTKTRAEVTSTASKKIESIPPVTESRKALGNDFRRVDVRKDWEVFNNEGDPHDLFHIARIKCIASSGTYMRSLAEVIASRAGSTGLALCIHRTKIGTYQKIPLIGGIWKTKYS